MAITKLHGVNSDEEFQNALRSMLDFLNEDLIEILRFKSLLIHFFGKKKERKTMDTVYTIDIYNMTKQSYTSYSSALIPRIGDTIFLYRQKEVAYLVKQVIFGVDNTKKEAENIHLIEIHVVEVNNPLS